MGLWGKLVKSVDVWGEGDATFVALLKKWNEIFKRTDFTQYYWNVIKPKENPATVEEACTTLVADDFIIKFWQDTYQGLGWADKVWYSHSHKFKCEELHWESAYYQIHIVYAVSGKALVLDYITGCEDDIDYEESVLRLSFFTGDGSVDKTASATGETEHSDGIYPPDMFNAMEKPKTGERLMNFINCMNAVVRSADSKARAEEWAKAHPEEAKQEELEKPEMNPVLDDALGDLD